MYHIIKRNEQFTHSCIIFYISTLLPPLVDLFAEHHEQNVILNFYKTCDV